MITRKSVAIAAALGTMTAALIVLQARAGGDKIAFPENYAQGVIYMPLDRADLKEFREYYITAAAVDAAKKGEPLPSGTVITAVRYKVQLGPDGNPVKGADGHFVKTGELNGYVVMEKRTGWGAEYPEAKRNGEWEYQVFTPDKKPNDKANLSTCFECHKPHADTQYLFTLDKIKAAAK
jgi:Cytochrome P460